MGLGNQNEEYGYVRASNIEQNEYEKNLLAKRTTEIPSNLQMRVEWNSGNPIYIGYAPQNLSISASGWLLQKNTFDASGNLILRQICFNAWDDRTLVVYS